ncbi:MAG: SDR family NAD(P)-dependent oxidoreductase [bacterium]|nr:SDR family NAD(P)-dependent oxidoreductase [bacterium]
MDWKAKYGPWALVTGASVGLGADFVRQLAAKGLNIVLVARRQGRMETLAQEVQNAHGIQTRIIAADLTSEGACQQVIDQTSDLEVGLLVNNAGFGMSGEYHTLDADHQVKMTVLNCVVPVLLTNHYLPPMLERGRGGMIFLASIAAYQPTPTFSTYGATKAFNLMLGESLWREYRKQGVDCLALSPGYTQTEFADVAKMQGAGGLRVAKSENLVAWGLKKLGKKGSTIHGLLNFILAFSVRTGPRRLINAISYVMLRRRSKTA